MGYKSLIDKQVQNAIKLLGTDSDGLADIISYVQHTGETYDPVSGSPTPTVTTTTGVECVFTNFTVEEKDDEVNVLTDQKCLIPSLNIPGIEPDENDEVTDSAGATWNVRRVMSPPGSSLFKLHVRKIR